MFSLSTGKKRKLGKKKKKKKKGNNKDISINYLQPMENTKILQSTQLSNQIQEKLREQAELGKLIILKQEFLTMLDEIAKKNKVPFTAQQLFEECLNQNLIHLVIRQFSGNLIFSFISMKLKTISIQSLIWVIISLLEDKMTPTEKLVCTRIKESYTLKIARKTWAYLLHLLLSNQNSIFEQSKQQKGTLYQLLNYNLISKTTKSHYKKEVGLSPGISV